MDVSGFKVVSVKEGVGDVYYGELRKYIRLQLEKELGPWLKV